MMEEYMAADLRQTKRIHIKTYSIFHQHNCISYKLQVYNQRKTDRQPTIVLKHRKAVCSSQVKNVVVSL